MKKVLVRKDAYFDSVVLMLLSRELKDRPGVDDAVVAMGTAMNVELLRSMGCAASDLAGASPNDLVIAVDAADPRTVDATIAAASEILARKRGAQGGAGAAGEAVHEPTSLEAALATRPGANVAVISLPGAYAAREARRALRHGLHVLLFSDNVSLEDEISLKRYAREQGLLLMGPDCGTAIINGKPLGFANVVRRGPVGVVAASGTGLQEVTCLVDRAGSGVSQAIGTGGRDLKSERVGGITMLMGIEALGRDASTQVIVVISKPPAAAVAAKVVAALEATGKPAIVHFIGLDRGPGVPPGSTGAAVRFAASLQEAADLAVATATGAPFAPRTFDLPEAAIEALVARETEGMAGGQRWIRGYFTGGTLADEAWLLLQRRIGPVYSNNQTDPRLVPGDPHTSVGHTIVDLGDDAFTVGRPHPMIDPGIRTERIDREAGDPAIAVMLVDVVLGYGSHPDPAGALLPPLVGAQQAATRRGGHLAVVASITGTAGDVQDLAGQQVKLERAGVIVMPSNFQASLLAARILERIATRVGGRP